jgi:hypothetical protein
MHVAPELHSNTQVLMLLVHDGPTTSKECPFPLTNRETSTTPEEVKVYSAQVLEICPLTRVVSG